MQKSGSAVMDSQKSKQNHGLDIEEETDRVDFSNTLV